jgi:bifunctional non-homologous end joining protein LigD
VLLCFDLLTLAGEDLTSLPLSDRRRRLEHLVGDLHPCLQLAIQTDDRQIAQEWLTILTSVEGVVAKRADGHYVAGRQRS